MDTATQFDRVTTTLTLHPAHLLIDTQNLLREKTYKLLQNIFCPREGCHTCSVCQSIVEQQHPGILWITPEKYYTLQDLAPLVTKSSFALEQNQSHFFVLEHADFLNQASANSLLKIVEEPPAGCHFIFLAQRLEAVIETIRSRCIIHNLSARTTETLNHPLITYLTQDFKTANPVAFLKLLDQVSPHERESAELLDRLISYWLSQGQKALEQNHPQQIKETQRILLTLKKAITYLPMPGSSKQFWKDLYLQLFV